MKSLVVVTLILLCRATFAEAEILYSSDPIGMELAAISSSEASGKEWVLVVSREGNTETRVLYNKGKETTRWVDTLAGGMISEEKTYDRGELSRVTVFQAGGLPVRVEDYSGGRLSGITLSRYSGGFLESRRVETGDGKLLYRDEYFRGVNGRLLRVIRSFPDGRQDVTAFDYANGKLVNEWLGNGGKGTLYRFPAPGNEIQEAWKGTTLVERQTTTPNGSGSEVVTRDFATGTVTASRYDKKGQIENRVETKNEKVLSTTDYRYAGDLLVSKTTRMPGALEQTRYFYSKDEKLARVEVTRNRSLVQVTHYTGAKTYYEDLYAEGHPVMRVYFENGVRTKEEPFSGVGQSAGPSSAGTAGS